MKTTRLKKKNTIPVSQNHLAAYLGIKSSTLSMGNSAKYKRKLPSEASKKLAYLNQDFVLMEFQPKKPGTSSVKIKVLEDVALKEEYNHLLNEAKYFEARAVELVRRFDEMCCLFRQNIRWLHVLDTRLAASPTKNDRIWLAYQQVVTTKRIKKNGTPAQFKMQLDIEMTRAKAKVYRNICGKIAANL